MIRASAEGWARLTLALLPWRSPAPTLAESASGAWLIFRPFMPASLAGGRLAAVGARRAGFQPSPANHSVSIVCAPCCCCSGAAGAQPRGSPLRPRVHSAAPASLLGLACSAAWPGAPLIWPAWGLMALCWAGPGVESIACAFVPTDALASLTAWISSRLLLWVLVVLPSRGQKLPISYTVVDASCTA